MRWLRGLTHVDWLEVFTVLVFQRSYAHDRVHDAHEEITRP